MPLQDFDARLVPPQQAGDKHPVGMFDFQITNTYLKPSKDGQHLMLLVEFSSPAGRIERNYIVDGASAQAIEIANKQISALCHAVNIFRLTYPKDAQGSPVFDQAARELRGGRGRMEVAFQKGHEPTAENPAGGYVEVRKVFDSAGNEPGKQGSQPQVQPAQQRSQQTPEQAPMTQQAGGGWGGGQTAANPNPAPQGNGGGWTPQGQAGAAQSPPWGSGK